MAQQRQFPLGRRNLGPQSGSFAELEKLAKIVTRTIIYELKINKNVFPAIFAGRGTPATGGSQGTGQGSGQGIGISTSNRPNQFSHLTGYSGAPEQTADVFTRASRDSLASAFVRQNTLTKQAVQQAGLLASQLSGTRLQKSSAHAYEIAKRALILSNREVVVSRASRKAGRAATIAERALKSHPGRKSASAYSIFERSRKSAKSAVELHKKTLADAQIKAARLSKHQAGALNALKLPSKQYQRYLNIFNKLKAASSKADQKSSISGLAAKSAIATYRKAKSHFASFGGSKAAKDFLVASSHAKSLRSYAKRLQNIAIKVRSAGSSMQLHGARSQRSIAKLAGGPPGGPPRGPSWGMTAAGLVGSNPFLAALTTSATALAALAAATIATVKALKDFTYHTFEANRWMSRYSAKTGIAYARFDIHEMQRDISYTRGTEMSSTRLVESMDKMRESWLKISISGGNVANKTATLLADSAAAIGDKMGIKIAESLDRIGEKLDQIDRLVQILGADPNQKLALIAKFGVEDMIKALAKGGPPANVGGPLKDFIHGMAVGGGAIIGGMDPAVRGPRQPFQNFQQQHKPRNP